MGTGHNAPDPDDGAQSPVRHYWRAGNFNVNVVEDAGKLDQYIQPPGTLSITVPLEYPADPNSKVTDDTADEELRSAAVYGRWMNREARMWLVDLDTGTPSSGSEVSGGGSEQADRIVPVAGRRVFRRSR